MPAPDHDRRTWLRAWRGWAAAAGLDPAGAVVHLARALAARGGAPDELVTGLETSLGVPPAAGGDSATDVPLPPAPAGPEVLGQAYEALLVGTDRRARGAFFTPADVARRLVELALGPGGATPEVVLDPAAGGGAFLLAAADALADRGVSPTGVLARLHGIDVDAAALGRGRRLPALVGHGPQGVLAPATAVPGRGRRPGRRRRLAG